MITRQKYWKRWSARGAITVLDKLDLNQVTWKMRSEFGDLEFAASPRPDFPSATCAEIHGFVGVVIAAPDDVGAARERVLCADRLGAAADSHIPIIPPLMSFEQAKNTTWAFTRDNLDDRGNHDRIGQDDLRRHLHRSRRRSLQRLKGRLPPVGRTWANLASAHL